MNFFTVILRLQQLMAGACFVYRGLFTKRFFIQSSFFLSLYAWAPLNAVHVSESRLFSVAGEDVRSVSFVREVAAQFEIRAERYFNFPASSSRILLRLEPVVVEDEKRQDRLQIFVSDMGLVTGSLRWDDSVSIELLCRLIAQSFLTRLSFHEGGRGAVDRLPGWLVVGLEHDLLSALRPAITSVWVQSSFNQAEMPIQILLQADIETVVRANSADPFWFFRILLSLIPERAQRRKFFQQFLAGNWQAGDWLSFIAPFLQMINDDSAADKKTPEGEISAWWLRMRNIEMAQQRSFYETLFESEQFLQSLMDTSIPALSLQDKSGLKQLWDRRANPQIRLLIEARLVLLASRMEHINPVYFNSAHALGVFYQILMRESSTNAQFLRALVDFLSEFSGAQALSRDVSIWFKQEETVPDK